MDDARSYVPAFNDSSDDATSAVIDNLGFESTGNGDITNFNKSRVFNFKLFEPDYVRWAQDIKRAETNVAGGYPWSIGILQDGEESTFRRGIRAISGRR